MDLFKITAAVMHWGNQKWKQKPREEQAEADGNEDITKVANLLGLDLEPFINGLLKPKIKVIIFQIFYQLFIYSNIIIITIIIITRSVKNLLTKVKIKLKLQMLVLLYQKLCMLVLSIGL